MIYSLGTWFLSPNGRQRHTMWLFKLIYVPTAWVIVHTHTHWHKHLWPFFLPRPFPVFLTGHIVFSCLASWGKLRQWHFLSEPLDSNNNVFTKKPLAGLCDSSKGCAGAAMCGAIFKLTRLEGNRAGFCYPLPSWWNTVFIQFSHPRNYPSSEVLFMFSADTVLLFLYITGTVKANKRRITMYKK